MLEKIVDRFNNERKNIEIVRDFAIGKTSTPHNERLYYNSSKIPYKKIGDKTATYRLYRFKQYIENAGDNDENRLDMYRYVTVYPIDGECSTIK